jgi:hypothetical protein
MPIEIDVLYKQGGDCQSIAQRCSKPISLGRSVAI